MEWTTEEKRLARELGGVALRGIKRILTGEPDASKTLQAMTKQLRGDLWSKDRVEAVEAVIRTAVDQLPDENMPGTEIRWWRAAAIYLRLAPVDITHKSGKEIARRLAVIRDEGNIQASPRTEGRITAAIRLQVARVLLTAVSQTEANGEASQAIGELGSFCAPSQEELGEGEQLSKIMGRKVDQARALQPLLSILRNVTIEQVSTLLKHLDYRNKLIPPAALFLRQNPDVSIDDLCTSIARDAAVVLDLIQPDEHPKITTFLKQFIESVARSNPDALTLLELLTFGPNRAPREVAASYLLRQKFIRRDEVNHANLALAHAAKPLQLLGLVTVGDLDITIDYLSQDILRSLLCDRFEGFIERARDLSCTHDDVRSAGWGPLTLAGRSLFFDVVNARVIDYFHNERARERRGEIGGPRWAELIEGRWTHMVVQELCGWLFSLVADSRDLGILSNLESYSFNQDLAPLQLREAEASRELLLHLRRQGRRNEEQLPKFDSLSAWDQYFFGELAKHKAIFNSTRVPLVEGEKSFNVDEWRLTEERRIRGEMVQITDGLVALPVE